MASLLGFPSLPPKGEIAIAEVNGICCVQKEFANISRFTDAVSIKFNCNSIDIDRAQCLDVPHFQDQSSSIYKCYERNIYHP